MTEYSANYSWLVSKFDKVLQSHQALILLTSTIGFPTVAASLSWAKDVIES